MKKVVCNNNVIVLDFAKAFNVCETPAKDDIITWGSLRYVVLRREFHDNGDIFIIVSQL